MSNPTMKAVMYHYVRPYDANFPHFKNLHVNDFENQLDYFEKEFGFVSKEDYLNALETGVPVPGVVLTFDDGFKDHVKHVLPVLRRRNLWGIFYITTGVYQHKDLLDVHKIHLLLGKVSADRLFESLQEIVSENMLTHRHVSAFREATYQLQQNDDHTNLLKRTLNYYIDYEYRSEVIATLMKQFFNELPLELFRQFYLSEDELKLLQKTGMILGSHTVHHPVMSKLSLQKQKAEIVDSFAFLEGVVGKLSIKTFCYPYGGFHTFTEETRKLLDSEAVQFSFNVEPRKITEADLVQHRQALPRFDCNQFPFGNCRT